MERVVDNMLKEYLPTGECKNEPSSPERKRKRFRPVRRGNETSLSLSSASSQIPPTSHSLILLPHPSPSPPPGLDEIIALDKRILDIEKKYLVCFEDAHVVSDMTPIGFFREFKLVQKTCSELLLKEREKNIGKAEILKRIKAIIDSRPKECTFKEIMDEYLFEEPSMTAMFELESRLDKLNRVQLPEYLTINI